MSDIVPDSGLASEFLLRPGVAFLNHGSFDACPRPVFEVYQRWQRQLEEQPVEFLQRRLGDLLAQARTRLAAYAGVQADTLLFVPNATQGINSIARSLNLQPGDEVLTSDHEYGAADRTWRFVCARRGARYINQPIAIPVEDPDALVEQLWAGVTDRTRVIFISHISSPTALIFPVGRICARARAAGILTVVDGAHAPGQIPLALEALGADFYSGNCHKWLCNQRASAFLYVRPELQSTIQPLVVSWGWEPEVPGPSRFHDLFDWPGTFDPSAYLSVPAAIDFQEQHNWPAVRRACHQLLREASQRMVELTGLPHLSPDSFNWWAQMRTFPLPECDIEAVKRLLWEDYHIEVPLLRWNGRPFIRISIQAYNTAADVERLLQALAKLLPTSR